MPAAEGRDRDKSRKQSAGRAEAQLKVWKRSAGAGEERHFKRAKAAAAAFEDSVWVRVPRRRSADARGVPSEGCRESQAPEKGGCAWHPECQTCQQEFTGAMQLGLAQARWSKVRRRDQEDQEWQEAASMMDNLARSLQCPGKYMEAEKMQREVLRAKRRVLGAQHPSTLLTADDLAISVCNQGKKVEAEKMFRKVHAGREQVLGAEHPQTLATAGDLATILSNQGEREKMLRKVLEAQQRVLKLEHRNTLLTAGNLASSLLAQVLGVPPFSRLFFAVLLPFAFLVVINESCLYFPVTLVASFASYD